MICPRDNIPLTRRRFDEAEFHFCDKCHGLWFTKSGLSKILKRKEPPRLADPMVLPVTEHDPWDHAGLCPVGQHAPLSQEDRFGVNVDFCREHEGIWLDRGELEKYITGRKTKFSAVGVAVEVGGQLVFEIILNAIFEIIGAIFS